MHESVRSASIDDCGDVHLLEAEARAALVGQRGGPQFLAEQPAVGDWVALLARSDRAVLVGTLDDIVFGYLELAMRNGTAVVRQVYVHPGARELGLGDALLGLALDRARASGCSVLEGTALPGDRDTKNLYERAGITARKLTVSKPL